MSANSNSGQPQGGPNFNGPCSSCKKTIYFIGSGPSTAVVCPYCQATTSFRCDQMGETVSIPCTKCSTTLQFPESKVVVDVRCFSCGTLVRYTPKTSDPSCQPKAVYPYATTTQSNHSALPQSGFEAEHQPYGTVEETITTTTTTTTVVEPATVVQPTVIIEQPTTEIVVVNSYGYYGGGYWCTPYGCGFYGSYWRPWYGYCGGRPCGWYGPEVSVNIGGHFRARSPVFQHSFYHNYPRYTPPPAFSSRNGPQPTVVSQPHVISQPHVTSQPKPSQPQPYSAPKPISQPHHSAAPTHPMGHSGGGGHRR